MRLMIIRHGDPDYDEDSLTPTGWREAEALSERMKELPVTKFYVSPLGRAKDTASLTLQKMGREAEVCTWLREFCPPYIKYPSTGEKHICWDWLPEDWMTIPEFFDHDHWMDHPAMQESSVGRIWQETVDQFDLLLASHGYRREGKYYRAENRNRDLIVFFLPFRTGVCSAQPPSECLTYGSLARHGSCSHFCDNSVYRGAQRGHCQFQDAVLR